MRNIIPGNKILFNKCQTQTIFSIEFAPKSTIKSTLKNSWPGNTLSSIFNLSKLINSMLKKQKKYIIKFEPSRCFLIKILSFQRIPTQSNFLVLKLKKTVYLVHCLLFSLTINNWHTTSTYFFILGHSRLAIALKNFFL